MKDLDKYLKAVAALKAQLTDAECSENALDCIYGQLYSYYSENNIAASTSAGKKALQEAAAFREMLRNLPELQQMEDGSMLPICEKVIEDFNYTVGFYEEAALIEGMRIGMRLILDVMD